MDIFEFASTYIPDHDCTWIAYQWSKDFRKPIIDALIAQEANNH